MSLSKSLFGVAFALLGALAAGGAVAAPKPVVMELFTSNSCSSCPPAYSALERLQAHPPANGVKLIRLDEHVDYWNKLDWVDRYSDAFFTQRQQQYAHEVFGSNQVYTPQLVVNGQRELVGSNSQEATSAIRAQASQTDRPVSLKIDSSNGRKIGVDVSLAPHTQNGSARVWLALTEDGVVSHVGAGENAGRTLHEDGVVRAFKPIGSLTPSASRAWHFHATLTLPRQVKDHNMAVVAFVQQDGSRAIVGAAQQRLGQRVASDGLDQNR